MAGRHLHELLREEQEPFALSRFIDERRCQLRRPHSGNPTQPGLHRHAHPQIPHHHLQIKRHVSDVVSENRAFSPSALVKSPSSPFIPRRELSDVKRSPLLHLPVEKSPSSASRITAALLLEAAMRIQRQQEQQQQQQPGGNKRRKRRKKKETDNPSSRFGLGFLASMLKRLVVGKRQRGITGEEEAAPPLDVPANELLQWDSRYGKNAVERAVHRARYQLKEADMGDPHCGAQTVRDQHRKGGEERSPQRPTCHRCGIPECPQSDGGAFPSVSGRASAPAGKPSTSSPPRTQPQPSGPSPRPRVPSPDLQTPAASPDHRRTETQLFGGTGDDGRPATTYYEEKKEQFSPVSVLDPPSDEEDHHHHHHRQHSPTHELDAQVEQQEQQEVEEDDEEAAAAADVDSFQHSLAVVQRAKQQLLSRLRRFERLAELDPVELERRLAEEDDEDDEEEDEDGGDSDGRPEAVGCLQDGAEAEACELVRAVLGLPGAGSSRKIPADTRRLVLDLAEEERRGRRGVFWGPAAAPPDGVERTAEGVRRRFEAWKGVESDTIDMMVGVDLRQEGGDGWRMFPDEVREAAAEVEAAAFSSLVDELMDELVGYVI